MPRFFVCLVIFVIENWTSESYSNSGNRIFPFPQLSLVGRVSVLGVSLRYEFRFFWVLSGPASFPGHAQWLFKSPLKGREGVQTQRSEQVCCSTWEGLLCPGQQSREGVSCRLGGSLWPGSFVGRGRGKGGPAACGRVLWRMLVARVGWHLGLSERVGGLIQKGSTPVQACHPHTLIPHYLQRIHSMTPSGCLKPYIYTIFPIYIHIW